MSRFWTRRAAMSGCGAAAVAGLASSVLAEAAYPSRAIKMIVPYQAGGTIDLLGRMVGDQLRSGLNATVIVENKPGAATVLGAEQVARANGDGYTLLTATSTTLAINEALYRKLPCALQRRENCRSSCSTSRHRGRWPARLVWSCLGPTSTWRGAAIPRQRILWP